MPCVDPGVAGNGDGTISSSEADVICAANCPLPPGGYPFQGPAFESENGGGALGITPPFDGCSGSTGTVPTNLMSCNPDSPVHTAPYADAAPPTYKGSFSSSDPASQADITVNGVTQSVDFTGTTILGVSDCESRRRQEVCVLDLQSLRLDLDSSPRFGDYAVDTAQLQLNLPSRTTVSFVCDSAGCSGSFDFMTRTGTSLAADFAWDQTNVINGAPGGGAIALGEDKLGNITRVVGELDLDTARSSGTIRMWGRGQDAFGGDTAAVTFDLRGPVSKL